MPRRPADAGTVIDVWIQPRASRDEVAGIQGDAVKIRVTAPAVEGRANEALLRFLARRLGLPGNAIRIVSGALGRRKAVRVEGLLPHEILARLGIG